jgi:transcriptional regulator with XRE-family HTH domain
MRVRTKAQAAREAAGLSVDQAAKRARLCSRYVRQLELHGRAPLPTAQVLARIYRCPVTLFLYPAPAD